MIPTVRSRHRRSVARVLAAGIVAAAASACSMPGSATQAPAGVGAGGIAGCPNSQPAPLGGGESRLVTIDTELGSIEITVQADLSPIATGNFVALAECGFYDRVLFHRVVPGFVIQAGDGEFGRMPAIDARLLGSGGPGYEIQDEPVSARYGRGVVAMARTPAPNSAGSQFFIVLDDAARSSLEAANTYQIIGSVTGGMETADAIAESADAELPSQPVEMTDVSVSTP